MAGGPKYGTIRFGTDLERSDKWHLMRYIQLQRQGLYGGRLDLFPLGPEFGYDIDYAIGYAYRSQQIARRDGEKNKTELWAGENDGQTSSVLTTRSQTRAHQDKILKAAKAQVPNPSQRKLRSAVKKSGLKGKKPLTPTLTSRLQALLDMPTSKTLALLRDSLLLQQHPLIPDLLVLASKSAVSTLTSSNTPKRVHWPSILPLHEGNTDCKAYQRRIHQSWTKRSELISPLLPAKHCRPRSNHD